MTIKKLVLAKILHHLVENILGQSQNLSEPNFFITWAVFFYDNLKTCLSKISSSPRRKHSKTIKKLVLAQIVHHLGDFFYDNLKTCLSQISSSPRRKHSKTISKLVLAKLPHHLVEKILRQSKNLS